MALVLAGCRGSAAVGSVVVPVAWVLGRGGRRDDSSGRLNLSLLDVGGELLVVSQFTLLGDCRKGRRPSFVRAMRPERAEPMIDDFVARARSKGVRVATGQFGATMIVTLEGDGPVTLLIDSKKEF